MLLSYDVLMLNRDYRNVESYHRTGLASEIPRTGDDVFAGDVALICRDQPLARSQLGDRRYSGVAIDCGPPLPCAFGQCLGQVGWLNIAILWMLDRADHAIGVAQRPNLLDLIRSQEFDIDANSSGDSRIVVILIQSVLGCRKPNVRNARKTDIELGFGFKTWIEAHRILVQLANGIAEIEQRK